MKNSVPCAIVLYPTSKLANLAYQTHKNLEKQGSLATSSDREYDAHLSLYLLQVDLQVTDKIKQILEELVESTRPINLTAKEIRHGGGWVDVTYEPNEAIVEMQRKVIEKINPLRDGLRTKDEESIGSATGIVLENLQKYGYRGVGKEFVPHVTFARFINKDARVKIAKNIHEFDGIFASIGMFELGDYGTCVRKFFEIHLELEA